MSPSELSKITEKIDDFAEKIYEKFDALDDRLFKDNGSDCLQTKINKNTLASQRNSKILVGIISTLGTFLLAILGYSIKNYIGT